MGSEDPPSLINEANVPEDVSEDRSCHSKNKGKVPKRIHKAEREKLRREHLNDLFLDLGGALELTQPNNGKASILCEATRLLKDLVGQVQCLRKENASLLSESHYVTVEKGELMEENSALESQIEKLQAEVEARVVQLNSDLNIPLEYQQPELRPQFPGECLGLPTMKPGLPQAPAVFVVPICPEVPSSFTAYTPVSHVSKPHARYPDSTDSWPLRFLGDQPSAGKEFQHKSVPISGEHVADNL
ncbi:transcription factor bHLH47 [Tripterygium wilfordii]|uniref:Transcription factor bHLH47 n=1 Tax=Tripterygium wilfordii TaxID=458696 RepID=A0A7J7CJC1_TRIWF|nr:transcription factor bHLH47-like [Tripterygium wilfordii]XP_038679150.1 transcription factor bHLH47-like [Tripterygium wilfordii]KAF5734150.1 transcription factor bHLH47 [Tripterygium wilfordii]